MDYTTNYSLAKPEDGARNAGQAVNGNMETIDKEFMKRENLVLSNNVFLKSGNNMIYHNLGVT